MNSHGIIPTFSYRFRGDKGGGGHRDDAPEEQTEDIALSEDEELILCRHCSQPVTHPSERIEKLGAHQHTYANPHGIVFEIGCFRLADGCGYTGPKSGEFTWFKGYDWRIAVCKSCLTHLGWLFASTGGDRFHGLILDRLKGSI